MSGRAIRLPSTARSEARLARDLRDALRDIPPEAQLLLAGQMIEQALTQAGLLGDLIKGMHITAGENPERGHVTVVPTEKAMLLRMAPYPDEMGHSDPPGRPGPASPEPPGL